MLRALKDIHGYQIAATDGDIGQANDFYFDDQRWTIRYLVVETGGFWKGPHHVLISPLSFRQADWSTQKFHLSLDREKVKNSPTADLDMPVSRQFELAYHHYYGWPPYWGFGEAWDWGVGTVPGALAGSTWKDERDLNATVKGDPHLRSTQAVSGYQVKGSDGDLGFVADFIIDDETWSIRYLVVETHKLWFGKRVLVAPRWVEGISWSEKTLSTNLTRETIKSSPEWSADEPVNREYESRLYDYYGRPAYWLDTDRAKEEAPRAELPKATNAPGR